MNIGIPVLDAIGATWDFSAPNININGQSIDLVENTENANQGSICQVKHLEEKTGRSIFMQRKLYLYNQIVSHISN